MDKVVGFMRITMLTIGSIGDVRPCINLAKELSLRGHEITIAAFPKFQALVEANGFRFHALDGDADKMIGSIMQPDTSGFTYLPRLMKSLRVTVPELIRSLTDSCIGADAMVCNFFGSVYYSISEKFHIPCVQINFFPMDPTGDIPISSIRNQHLGRIINMSSYRIGYIMISLLESRYLSGWRKNEHLSVRGIHSLPDYSVGENQVPVIYAISPSLLPRPSEWNPRIYMSGFLFDDHSTEWMPAKDITAFLAEGRPPVYIGFGSMNSGDMNKLITITLRAVRSAGIRAVIDLSSTGRKLHSSRQVFFMDKYVSHEALFPRVSAVIHHGGAGTTSTGLRFGKPTLIIPFAGDQPFWGNLVWQRGCGPKPVPRSRLTVQRLTKGILDLISQSKYTVNAKQMAVELSRENGIKTASDIIEKEITSWK